MNNLNQLIQIYNALCLVHTNGEDSFIMVDCLKALQAYIKQAQQSNEIAKEE